MDGEALVRTADEAKGGGRKARKPRQRRWDKIAARVDFARLNALALETLKPREPVAKPPVMRKIDVLRMIEAPIREMVERGVHRDDIVRFYKGKGVPVDATMVTKLANGTYYRKPLG